jgi:chromosome partitioning protein
MGDIIQPITQGLDLAPADLALSNSELGIQTRYNRELVLSKALGKVKGNYDLAIIDCGPSLGLLVINGLAAADSVITPTLPTALDLRGLKLFLDSLEVIQAEINPRLQLLGVLVCQYENRLTLHRAALEDMHAGGLPVLPTMISKSVKAAAAAGAGEPIDRGNLATQYRELAEYVNQWLKT